MACPQQINIKGKRNKKYTKQWQVVFDLRQYQVQILPNAVEAFGGGITDVLREVGHVFSELPETELMITRTVFEIQQTFSMGNGNII